MEQERLGRIEESIGTQSYQEIHIIIRISGNKFPVILRQKEEGGAWDIVDGRRQEWVGTLSPELDGPLQSVINAMKDQFGRN